MNREARARPVLVAAACVAAGACLGWAFIPGSSPARAWAAFLPFFWVTDRCSPRDAFFRGWLAGSSAWAVGLFWLAKPVFELTGSSSWKGFCFLALFYGLLGLHFAFVAAAASFCARGRDRAPGQNPGLYAASLALALVGAERFFPAVFPPFLCLTQTPRLITVQSLDLFGTAGIAALVAGFNAALYYAARRSCDARGFARDAGWVLVCAAAVAGANEGYGRWRIGRIDSASEAAPTLRIAAAQASIPEIERDGSNADRNLARYAALTRDAIVADAPDLVVWPESAYERFLEFEPDDEAFERPFLRGRPAEETLKREMAFGVSILTGSDGKRVLRRETGRRIVRRHYLSLLVGGDGDYLGAAAKRYPTPFSEAVPGATYFPPLNRLFPKRVPIRSGRQDPLRMEGGILLGAFICYDAVVDASPRSLVARGSSLLVELTSDQWSRVSQSYELHLQYSIMRAVEHRRALVRSAVSGISAFVTPGGRVLDRVERDASGWIAASLPLMSGRTPANRLGEVPYGFSLLLLAACGIQARRRRS